MLRELLRRKRETRVQRGLRVMLVHKVQLVPRGLQAIMVLREPTEITATMVPTALRVQQATMVPTVLKVLRVLRALPV